MIASLFICPEGGITVAKAKTPFEKAASKILERRGVSETQWKQEVLEKAQFDLLRGKDKDLYRRYVDHCNENSWENRG